MLLKCCTQYVSKFGDSTVATGLVKISFHSNPKERQCQRKFKLLHNCTHLTWQESNAQNSPSEASIDMNWKLPDVQAGFKKGRETRDQIANICWIIEKAKELQETIFTFPSMTMLKPLTVWITTNWKILKEMGMPEHLTCPLWNLYAETTVRTGHGTTNWFQIGKGLRQGCILSPCLFNFYAEYIKWNARLNDSQAGTKISGRNVNNLRFIDDTTVIAESKEELKSLLMRVKEESEKPA